MTKEKERSILSPALNPSRLGREVLLLFLDGLRRAQSSRGGWERVNKIDKFIYLLVGYRSDN
jgi:hypothetical protein